MLRAWVLSLVGAYIASDIILLAIYFFNIKCCFLIFCNISCDFLMIVLIISGIVNSIVMRKLNNGTRRVLKV